MVQIRDGDWGYQSLHPFRRPGQLQPASHLGDAEVMEEADRFACILGCLPVTDFLRRKHNLEQMVDLAIVAFHSLAQKAGLEIASFRNQEQMEGQEIVFWHMS